MEVEKLHQEFTEGTGTPLVFIHGWLGSMEDWQKVRHHLDLENPMLFYDQRCHGNSECGEFTIEDLADDLHSLLDRYDIEKPVLVGHSMGGMVALAYFVKYCSEKDDLSGLFLVGTSASTPEPANGSPEYFLENFGKMDRREWAGEVVENYVGEDKPEARKLAFEELVEAGETEVRCGLESMIDYNVTGELQEKDVRSLVISGQRDNAITRDKSKELSSLLDSKIIELDSSHLINFEKPRQVAQQLEKFVE